MNRLSRLTLSPEARARFDELIQEAPALGIDPEKVASAGMPGLKALLALKQARAGTRAARKRHLGDLQSALATLLHRKHSDLAVQFQARAMALQGRGSDTEVAHVARNEIVVPLRLQTPEVLAALGRAAGAYNVPVDMLRVGNALNQLNPTTGAPEFGVMDWISGLFGGQKSPAQNDPGDSVRIIQSPYSPCDPRYIEELESAKAEAREFPPENNPIIQGINAAAEAMGRMIHKNDQPSPTGKVGGPRG